jgi:hypothetical protein
VYAQRPTRYFRSQSEPLGEQFRTENAMRNVNQIESLPTYPDTSHSIKQVIQEKTGNSRSNQTIKMGFATVTTYSAPGLP